MPSLSWSELPEPLFIAFFSSFASPICSGISGTLWPISPRTVFGFISHSSVQGEIGHKIAEIPEHVGDADEEKNGVDNGPGSPDQDEDNEDKVNQNDEKGQVSIDVLNGLAHSGSKKTKDPTFF